MLHEEPTVVPQNEDFMDDDASAKFLPSLSNLKDEQAKALRYAEFMDNSQVACGGGGFQSRVVDKGENYSIVEWETGARWVMRRRPLSHFMREYVRYPVMVEEDLDALQLPDPDDSERYVGIQENVRYFTEKGYFTTCGVNGFFSGVWYFLRPFRLWLKDLVLDLPFARRLIAKVGEFNLGAERNLLETGVHCITWVDDLGYNKGTFISPRTYEEVVYPWHREAIRLAHRHGAFVNMHSHGNINAIVPSLVDAGLDALNPIGPSDNMDLATLKEKYGDHLTLDGGISKHIGEMTQDQIREHVKDRLAQGSPGGGYILRGEGGIPLTMSFDNFTCYLKCSRKYRKSLGPT